VAIVRAKESFAYTDTAGVPRVVTPGQLFDGADPCVVKRPNLFEPVEVAVERRRATVEDASAVPGEHRSVSTRKPATKRAEAAAAAFRKGTD
jgi:hypothetical protein